VTGRDRERLFPRSWRHHEIRGGKDRLSIQFQFQPSVMPASAGTTIGRQMAAASCDFFRRCDVAARKGWRPWATPWSRSLFPTTDPIGEKQLDQKHPVPRINRKSWKRRRATCRPGPGHNRAHWAYHTVASDTGSEFDDVKRHHGSARSTSAMPDVRMRSTDLAERPNSIQPVTADTWSRIAKVRPSSA